MNNDFKNKQKEYYLEIKEIKNHKAFFGLNITEDFIISNYEDIKLFLKQIELCNDKMSMCNLVDKHLILLIDEYGNMSFEYKECNKTKNFSKIDEVGFQKLIKKNLKISNDINYSYNQAMKEYKDFIDILKNFEKDYYVKKFIKFFYKNKYKSYYLQLLAVENIKKYNFAILQNYIINLLILSIAISENKEVTYYDSKDLKRLVYSIFNKNIDAKNEWDSVKKTKHLIISNVGIENGKVFYYFDYLQELIFYRLKNNLSTIFLSPFSVDNLCDIIKKSPSFKENILINEYNLEEFKLLLDNLFYR